MTRTTNPEAITIKQCTAGRRIRNVECKSIVIANDRGSDVAPARVMADAIRNETEVISFFVAPCACRVVRLSANGTPFADMDVAGTVTATWAKAVIGGANVSLNTALTIGSATAPTLDTVTDATLSTTAGALDLIEGQHVYCTVAVSNHAVETAVAYVTLMMEWIPIDAPE